MIAEEKVAKKLRCILMILTCSVNVSACSPYVSWKEEVELSDGRIIVVEQKKLAEGSVARESWLTIHLPEVSAAPVVWHEHLDPLILNVDHGMLYAVGDPPTARELRFYDCPEHGVVGFVWQAEMWHRIAFEQIPVSIYKTNMLIESFPPKGTSFLTLAQKNSAHVNDEPTLRKYWRLDPNRRIPCF